MSTRKFLSHEGFEQARLYIHEHGRLLDIRRYAYYFGPSAIFGDADTDIIRALTPFQNEDGGFGHGLEPDLRTPASSAVATQQAFNIFQEIKAPYTWEMVQNAVRYLLDTLDEEKLVWPIVPPAVEDAPHAPWWQYEGIAERFDHFQTNPTAALVGHLHHYTQLVPEALLTRLRTAVVDRLDDLPDAMDMFSLHAYMTLTEAPKIPDDDRERVLSALRKAAAETVVTDPAGWDDYVLMPLDVALTSTSPLASAIPRSAIDAHLDWLIEQQKPDGSWPLPWNWSFVDANAWAQAERDWNAQRAVNYLRTLQLYARIEK